MHKADALRQALIKSAIHETTVVVVFVEYLEGLITRDYWYKVIPGTEIKNYAADSIVAVFTEGIPANV